jgi:hypothetical protein
MAIYDNPDKITGVLLADGWHPVMEGSFILFGLPADVTTEFRFVSYIDRAIQERIGIGGLLSNVLAVQSDSRMIGQLARRRVQPDGHLEVLLADGEWHPITETTQ